MSGFSPLEALRAVFSIVVACVSVGGFWRAGDGSMAFARPIRSRMVKTRRVQMAIYLTIAIVWLIQAIIAGSIESPWPPSGAAIYQTFAVIYTVSSLAIVSIYQYIKWSDFERIVGNMPLVPDPDSVGVQTSIEARPIMHQMDSVFTQILGRLFELRESTILPSNAREQLGELAADIDAVIDLHKRSQALVRSISVEVVGGES